MRLSDVCMCELWCALCGVVWGNVQQMAAGTYVYVLSCVLLLMLTG